MCGIAGIISLTREGSKLGRHINKMASTLSHRGPDGEGFLLSGQEGTNIFYGNDSVLDKTTGSAIPPYIPSAHISTSFDSNYKLALAHRRLSIVDISLAGHQPMSYLNRYWIVFNGEIYNYIELREQLEKEGYSFFSHTDTEVIMAAYHQWGPACFNRFNGMWAFALFDTEKNRLVLSRDRFGIKPLHYYTDGNVFLFASEIKAILSYEGIKTAPNIDYCRQYLVTGPREYTRETAFMNIFRMDCASYAEIDLDNFSGQPGEKKFWSLKPATGKEKFDEKKLAEYAGKYYELLYDAVKLRLRADVKVGSALSGGLDSSAVVYMINEQLRKEQKVEQQETFSSVYKSEAVKEFDESVYIDNIASQLNVHSNQVEPREEDVIKEHRKMIYHMDTPPESSCMSGWHTFMLVGRSDVTVTLDGQGADEQQAGYLIYLVNYLSQHSLEEDDFRKIPGSGRFISAARKLRAARRLLPGFLAKKLLRKLNLSEDYLLPLNERLVKDTTSNLLTLIHYSDRISMAFSVESRMPYMDYRLAEFLAAVPDVYKLHKGWTKYIAREAMNGKLPDHITWRKDKMGWPIPEDYWFRGNLREQFCSTIESSAFLKQLNAGRDIRERIKSSEPITNLVRLYNLAVWHEVFFSE